MTETSWVDRRAGTVELRVRIDRDGVVETVRIVTDEAGVPRGVYAAVQGPSGWRTLEALPRPEGGWLAVVVSAPDGRRQRRDFPDLPRDVLVDYPSEAVRRARRERLARAPGPMVVLRIGSRTLEASVGEEAPSRP